MFTNARNPKWAEPAHTKIILEVELNGNEWAGFVASPTDCTEYGPMLFNFAANGIFGPVANSDDERIIAGELPVPDGYIIKDGGLINIGAYEREATEELNRRLAEFTSEESKARAEIDADYAAERKDKMAALLAVKEQEGWPLEVTWPQ